MGELQAEGRQASGLKAVLIVVALAATPCFSASDLDDKLVLHLGSYLAEFRTDASVGSGGVVGTALRLEDELGVENDMSMFRLEGLYRIKPRQSIGFGYWSINRDGFATIDDDIEFDGNTYAVGAEITSQFDVTWIRADWRYSLVQSDRGEAGISAGLSTYDFAVGLDGEALVSDGVGGFTLERIRAEEGFLAPAPTIGMFMTHAFKPRLLLRVKADFLNVEISDLEVRLLDTSLLLDWYFSDKVGLGIGTNTTELDIRDTGTDPFSVDYRQTGFLLHLNLAF